MAAFVYILESTSGKFYIGSTTDLPRRVAQHQSGHTPSTRRLGQMQLIFSQEYSTLNIARQIERKLKKLKRKDYLQQIVRDGFIRTGP